MHASVTRKLAMRVDDKQVGLFSTAGMRGTADAAQIPGFAPTGQKCTRVQNGEGAPKERCTEALFREREGVYSGGRLLQSILSDNPEKMIAASFHSTLRDGYIHQTNTHRISCPSLELTGFPNNKPGLLAADAMR